MNRDSYLPRFRTDSQMSKIHLKKLIAWCWRNEKRQNWTVRVVQRLENVQHACITLKFISEEAFVSISLSYWLIDYLYKTHREVGHIFVNQWNQKNCFELQITSKSDRLLARELVPASLSHLLSDSESESKPTFLKRLQYLMFPTAVLLFFANLVIML